MRTQADTGGANTGSGARGYVHECARYASDAQFLAVVVPFLSDGVRAGEPTVAALGPANQRLVRGALGGGPGIHFLAAEDQYARPALTIRRYRELFAGFVAAGASRIRLVGDVPHPGTGVPWDGWARYEAASNSVYRDYPLWGLCAYDTRTAPAGVLAEVNRLHPHLASPGGYARNPDFTDPRAFLRERTDHWQDPLELSQPTVELVDPTPQAARAAVLANTHHSGLSEEDTNGLVLAASEAVGNALRHGCAPVRLRLWTAAERVVLTVTDAGAGPSDPYAGLVPLGHDGGPGVDADPRRLGLWLTHQLCAYVGMHAGPDGFTLRLVAGRLEVPQVPE
jgi:anti-sigma regulatory factor (Ser/Thr protein kinase)